jgi:transcriptional regulator with XRE-family HTH domain
MSNIVLIVEEGQVSEDGLAGPTATFITRLGEQLRSRRKRSGLTVQQLAERSGLSRRMLTQIELGQANPSLATVDKLARALGADFSSLARDEAPVPLAVNPPQVRPDIWTSAHGSRATLQVATTLRPPAELWEWELQPGDGYRAEPDPAGSEELFLVITGVLTIVVDGTDPMAIPAGASARLLSDRGYAYENRGELTTRFVRVVQLSQ